MEGLKPCPFCGGKAIYTNNYDTNSNGGEYVTCTNCKTSTALVYGINEDAKPLLAERWNRRTEYLSGQHQGMKISAEGLLGRIRDGQRPDSSQRWGVGEMLIHLRQMAGQFYSGDISAVDEFLQLYCLDGSRPIVEG
jgi:Lar family restriction alleviation protein